MAGFALLAAGPEFTLPVEHQTTPFRPSAGAESLTSLFLAIAVTRVFHGYFPSSGFIFIVHGFTNAARRATPDSKE
jgi:hypothetical protein